MIGRLVDLTVGLHNRQRLTVEINGDFREQYEQLNGAELDIEIKKHRAKRSKSANAYFHVLVSKIAAARNSSEQSVKDELVLEYGELARDADGLVVAFKLPAAADVSKIYRYVKCYDQQEENGCLLNFYMVYKNTSDMNSREMARLIDGAIEVAKEYGIETDTPEEIARHKAYWQNQENSGGRQNV